MTTRKLTARQVAAMKRLAKEGGSEQCSPDLAAQLVNRGLCHLTGHKHKRYEWNRLVATLWGVSLTNAGRTLLAEMGIEIQKSLAERLNDANKN